EVVYVVNARCIGDLSGTLGIRASYEMLSTAGDPLTQTQPGYRHFDVDHHAWNLLYGAVDLPGPCSGYYGQQSYARSWSNAAIRGYHDPCVPTHDATPYFVSVPLMNDALTFQGQTTKGIHVPVGQSATVEVDLLSDGATSGPRTGDAQVMPKARYPASALTFMWDRNEPLGTNGEKLHLTVTANVAGPTP